MGTPTLKIPADAKAFPIPETTPDGVVFVVGRVVDKGEHFPEEIHFQAVCTTRKIAVACCRDETYFVGPFPVNVLLPSKAVQWIGLEFPLKAKSPGRKK